MGYFDRGNRIYHNQEHRWVRFPIDIEDKGMNIISCNCLIYP